MLIFNRIKGMETTYHETAQQKEADDSDKEHLALQLEIKENQIKDLKAVYATLSEEKDKLSVEFANLTASAAAATAKVDAMEIEREATKEELRALT